MLIHTTKIFSYVPKLLISQVIYVGNRQSKSTFSFRANAWRTFLIKFLFYKNLIKKVCINFDENKI